MSETNSSHWPYWQRLLFRFSFLFVGLLLLTFPMHRPYLPDFGSWLAPLTTALADWVAAHVWRLPPGYLPEIANDNTLLYVHLGNVLWLSLLGMGVWSVVDRRRVAYPRLQWGLHTAARYFLAAAMLSYGFAKVFKVQFYLPEPNTLFTPLGEVPRDLLFWSTMGTSRAYSLFAGSLEVIVGLLLLWRRTTLLGALIGLGVMGNVLAINLSFDISVKVYAAFLCLLCLLLIAPHVRRLLDFLMGFWADPRVLWRPHWDSGRRRAVYLIAKTLVVSALLFDSLALFVESGNFNDDLAPRPPYHGAYAVTEFVQNGDTLGPDLRESERWKRVFVHRHSYLIVQYMDDRMQDYVLEWDTTTRQISYLDVTMQHFGQFHFQRGGDSILLLDGVQDQDRMQIRLRKLDWRAMPLLRGEFHWTSDAM